MTKGYFSDKRLDRGMQASIFRHSRIKGARSSSLEKDLKQLSYSEWTNFGWEGALLHIPRAWNPGSITGDRKSGSVRLDDRKMARLEFEWREARGDDELGRLVDRYIEGLAKKAQKAGKSLNVERHPESLGLNLPDMRSVEAFSWESEFRVTTLACYSQKSDRVFFLRAMGHPEEDLSELLQKLFNSLLDTAPEAPKLWALYDLEFTSPSGYDLEGYDLKSGHIKLSFRKGRNLLQLDRVSLAEILLRTQALSNWYREFFKKDLRHYDFEIGDGSVRGHSALSVKGRPKSRIRGLFRPLPVWNVQPRFNLDGRAWSCETSNKIFVLHAFWKDQESVTDLCDSCSALLCHLEDGRSIRSG